MKGIGKYAEGSLVFIWNADAGWQHAILDSLHKVISPETYSCKLCQLTYGIAGPKVRWTKFLEAFERPVAFYHRDQFPGTPMADQFPELELPAVLTYSSKKWEILLSSEELMEFKDLQALLDELNKRI